MESGGGAAVGSARGTDPAKAPADAAAAVLATDAAAAVSSADGEPSSEGGFPPCPDGATARVVQDTQTCLKGGKPHGPSVTLWSTATGKRKSYSSYVDNVMVGPQVGWDEQGRLTFHAINNKKGRWVGTVTRYRDGKKDGSEGEYDENGDQIRTTTWREGVMQTTNELTCPAGTEKKVERGLTLTEDSMRENRTRVTCVKNGKPNGPYIDLYPGGELEITGTMINGKRTGLETLYHDTGQKFWEGKRVKDKYAGTWTMWRVRRGQPSFKETELDYNAKGQRVEERRYDEAGKMKGGTWYKNDEYVDSWTGDKPKK